MATMTCRSTFAFDPATIRSIRSLARRWRVSQAEAVRRAVEIARGNLAQAARELDISRSTLYKLIEKYGISL